MGSEIDWRERRWGDLASLEYGKALRGYQARKHGVRVYGTNGPVGYHDAALCPHAGVIVGRKGAYRGIHYSAAPFFVIDTAFYLEPKCDIDLRWAYFQLLTLDINGMDSGSAIPSTSRDEFYQLPVLVPPKVEQVAIADFLQSLNDRIDNLRATNATLEAIAQALFKSWFVDFDPVHAKAEGRAPAGMDAATAALFPSAFEDSELGPIPRGWRVDGLGTVGRNIREQAKPDELHPATPYIGLEHMPRGSIALTDHGVADGLASNKFWYQRNDILFGKLRPYFHKVGVAPDRGVCSTDILVVRPVAELWFGYSVMQFSSDDVISYATRLSNGAKMPRTNWHDLAKYPAVLPPPEVANAFDRAVRPLVAHIHANIASAETLGALRDALLPRLISGKLRLPETGAAAIGKMA